MAEAPAAVAKAQQQVWDRVAVKNRYFGTESATGTYRATLNMAGGRAASSIEPYVKALSSAPGTDSHVVGMAAAINGRVVAADVFGDTALFRKLWPKLLRAYAADAAEKSSTARAAAAPAAGEVRNFLVSAADSRVKSQTVSESGSLTRMESGSAVLYRMAPSNSRAATPLHENVLRK